MSCHWVVACRIFIWWYYKTLYYFVINEIFEFLFYRLAATLRHKNIYVQNEFFIKLIGATTQRHITYLLT